MNIERETDKHNQKKANLLRLETVVNKIKETKEHMINVQEEANTDEPVHWGVVLEDLEKRLKEVTK